MTVGASSQTPRAILYDFASHLSRKISLTNQGMRNGRCFIYRSCLLDHASPGLTGSSFDTARARDLHVGVLRRKLPLVTTHGN